MNDLLTAVLQDRSAPIEWIFYASDMLPMPEIEVGESTLRVLPFSGLRSRGDEKITAADALPMEVLYRSRLLADGVDAVFLPSPMEVEDCVLPDCAALPVRLYSVCLDLIPLIYADKCLDDSAAHESYHRRLRNLRFADGVFAISDATRRDAVNLLRMPEEKVHTIYAGVSPFFVPLDGERKTEWRARLRKKFAIGERFLLYNGGENWRKNQEGLIEAFGQLAAGVRDGLQLVFTCRFSETYIAELYEIASRHGVPRSALILAGYVSDEELRALYNLCTLFVYPSLHEGFGLPIVEAMACGAATIAADNSSLPEVVGDPEALFASGDVPAMASKIAEVLRNDTLLDSLRDLSTRQSSRFTWARAAGLCLEGMLGDLEAGRNEGMPANTALRRLRTKPEPGGKPRIAFLSPFPPAASGIADYSAELIPDLAAHFAVLPVTSSDQPPIPRDSPLREHVINPVTQTAFEGTLLDRESVGDVAPDPLACDGIIYQIGNSSWHAGMYALLCRFAGITVLHDYNLNGLLGYINNNRPDLGVTLDAELSHHYSDQAQRRVVRDAVMSGDAARYEELAVREQFSNRRIFTRSLGVVVHSEWALKKAADEFGGDCELIRRVPQLTPSRPCAVTKVEEGAARDKLGVPRDAFVVVTVGYVHQAKRSVPLLDAFRLFLNDCPEAYLYYVGSSEHAGDFDAQVANRGLQNRVKVTGFVPMDMLYDYVDAADACVALRYPSNGETSGGLLRILSRGKACVISRVGAFADYPDSVCHFLPPVPLLAGKEEEAIAGALAKLRRDPAYCESLAHAAWEYIRREHDPARCARMLADFYQTVYAHPMTRLRLLADYAGREAALAWVRSGRWVPGENSHMLPSLLARTFGGNR